jgi:hypothetical protein
VLNEGLDKTQAVRVQTEWTSSERVGMAETPTGPEACDTYPSRNGSLTESKDGSRERRNERGKRREVGLRTEIPQKFNRGQIQRLSSRWRRTTRSDMGTNCHSYIIVSGGLFVSRFLTARKACPTSCQLDPSSSAFSRPSPTGQYDNCRARERYICISCQASETPACRVHDP